MSCACAVSYICIGNEYFIVRVACKRARGLVCSNFRGVRVVTALKLGGFVSIAVKRFFVERAEFFNRNVIEERISRAFFAVRALT